MLFRSSQVDALESGTNISFDASATAEQERRQYAYNSEQRSGGRQEYFGQQGLNRLFDADSQVFAQILQDREGGARNVSTESAAQRREGTTLPRIISTYETNALVISGEQPIRGTTFSFNL